MNELVCRANRFVVAVGFFCFGEVWVVWDSEDFGPSGEQFNSDWEDFASDCAEFGCYDFERT